MAIRNIFAGGLTPYGAEQWKPSDINDTLNAIQARAAKDAGRNEINQVVSFDAAALTHITPNFIEKFTDVDGLNDTVDVVNTTSSYDSTNELYENIADLQESLSGTYSLSGVNESQHRQMSLSFVADGGSIDTIELGLWKLVNYGAVYSIQIFNADGSKYPTGTALGEITGLSANDLTTVVDTFEKFTFSSPVTLTNGNRYCIVINVTDVGTASGTSDIIRMTRVGSGSEMYAWFTTSWITASASSTAIFKIYEAGAETNIVMVWDKGNPTSVIVEVYDGDLDFVNIGDTKFQLNFEDNIIPPADATISTTAMQSGFDSYACTFTPSENKSVDKLKLKVRNVSSTGATNVFVAIYTVDGSRLPTGAALGTSNNVLVSSLPTDVSGDIVTFEFPSTVNLTSGIEYAVEFGTPESISGGSINAFTDTTLTGEQRSRFNGATWASVGTGQWYIGLGQIELTGELDVNTPQDLGVLSNVPDTLTIIQKDTASSKIGAVWVGQNK